MDTRPYVVREGEHLLQIATREGFDADSVWNDPKHDDLRKRGRTPDFLCAGDVLTIPDKPRKWVAAKVGQVNAFTAKVPKVKVSVAFAGMANTACIVHGIPPPNAFATDGDGKLEFHCPVHVATVNVEFPNHSRHQVGVGHLDPISEVSGQSHRLQNLGYLRSGTSFAAAVAAFQQDQKLTVSGQMDDATRDTLEKSHGG